VEQEICIYQRTASLDCEEKVPVEGKEQKKEYKGPLFTNEDKRTGKPESVGSLRYCLRIGENPPEEIPERGTAKSASIGSFLRWRFLDDKRP